MSEDLHAAQSARPKSRYTLAGFIGFWASFFAAVDLGRPSVAELMGRQPGQDGARVVNCTLNIATGRCKPQIAKCSHEPHALDAQPDVNDSSSKHHVICRSSHVP